jgi:hypothetical protein
MKIIVRLKKINNRSVVLALILTLLISSAFSLSAQVATSSLVLPNTPINIKAGGFYIAAIIDERADKKIIARLVPISTNSDKKMTESIALQGGGLTSIEQYLKQNFPYHNNDKAIIIRVQKLFVDETVLPDGRVDGKVDLSINFNLKTGEEMDAHLTNYKGTLHYTRSNTQTGVAELALRNTIESSMVYFNNWMGKQTGTNPLLAKEVKLAFIDFHDPKPEEDTIYYNKTRPITWADFKDMRPVTSKYAAAVMPGLGFTEQTSINKGIIAVHIEMKVYLPKSSSWVNAGSQSDYNLNHEQRHFDIVKLVSERFKRAMLAEKLPVLNYDGSINVAYFDALREIDRLQKQYDDETSHGTSQSAQEKWNNYIDSELAVFKN